MEIPELPGAVQGGGIEDDVIVDMRPVGMGGNDKRGEGIPSWLSASAIAR